MRGAARRDAGRSTERSVRARRSRDAASGRRRGGRDSMIATSWTRASLILDGTTPRGGERPATVALGFQAERDRRGRLRRQRGARPCGHRTATATACGSCAAAGDGTFALGASLGRRQSIAGWPLADFNGGVADLAVTNSASSVTVLLRTARLRAGEAADRRRPAPQGIVARGLQRRRAARPRGRVRHRLVRLLMRRPAEASCTRRARPVTATRRSASRAVDFNPTAAGSSSTANQAASTASIRLRTAAGLVRRSHARGGRRQLASACVLDANADGRPTWQSRTTPTTACRSC